MVAQYFASFLLTSAILLLNPQFFNNGHDAGTGDVRQVIEIGSGETIRLNGQWERQGALGATECKLSSGCSGRHINCRNVCRDSNNMKPAGSWVPTDPIETVQTYDCHMDVYPTYVCKCCKNDRVHT